jgi:hypothetical protein
MAPFPTVRMRFKAGNDAVLFVLCVISSLFSEPVMAQETIRVAVFQDMKALKLQSDGGMVIRRSHGGLLFAKPVKDLRIVLPNRVLLLINDCFQNRRSESVQVAKISESTVRALEAAVYHEQTRFQASGRDIDLKTTWEAWFLWN